MLVTFPKKAFTCGLYRQYNTTGLISMPAIEIALPWKRITRGMSKGRRYANDQVPTIEEIKCLFGMC